MKYLPLIQAIKAYTPLHIYQSTPELDVKIMRLVNAKIISAVVCRNTSGKIGLRITTIDRAPVNPPKNTPPATESHILVSHWREGERKDKPAGAKYPFIERLSLNGTEYVKYQLAPDKVHTIKAEYTKVIA